MTTVVISGGGATSTTTVGDQFSDLIADLNALYAPISGAAAVTSLDTTGAAVNVGDAAPPTAGKVLTATDATHATWQTPSGELQTGTTTTAKTTYGVAAGTGITSGSQNTIIGNSAGTPLTTGQQNTIIGDNAMNLCGNSVGNNIAIGGFAGWNLAGSNNMAIGFGAFSSNTSANSTQNVYIGNGSGSNGDGTSCQRNVAVGYNSLREDTGGQDNVAVGWTALLTNTTGNQQVGIGSGALTLATGGANTGVGYAAGSTITTGTNNTLLGSGASVNAVNSVNRIAIGQGAVCTADNTAMIGNSSITSVKWAAKTTGLEVKPIGIACSDETTALTTGTAKITFRMPYAMTLTSVRASLSTAQTSGSLLTVNIKESGTTIFSTKITFDNTEKTTTTAATLPVLSDTSLADDAEMTVDIDQVGDGTAKGLKIWLIGYPS